MEEWRLIVDNPAEGYVNMAVDEALLLSCESGEELDQQLGSMSGKPQRSLSAICSVTAPLIMLKPRSYGG